MVLPLFAVAQERTNNCTDSHFRRTSLFEELDIGRRDVVFLGDGLTDEGEWSELFNNRRVKNRGITGDLSSDVIDRLHLVTRGEPRSVFIMVGINDLCCSGTPESVAINVEQIIKRLKSESPRTEVYLQSILPVSDRIQNLSEMQMPNEEILKDIERANSIIEQLCVAYGVTYIDLHSLLVGGNGQIKPEYSSNGLHLVGEGYLAWREAIARFVR